MGLKLIYSLPIVQLLLFIQTVRSVVHLHYCTFRDGERCDTDIPINNTNRVLKIENYGMYMNLTCASTQAIRWVIHIPPESRIEGPDPSIRAQQQDNSSELTYNLNAQVLLWNLKGWIRCEAHNNNKTAEDYAQIFIIAGPVFKLMGRHDAMNFFIHSKDLVVIPCAGTVAPKTEKVKLFKTTGEKKVTNSVLDHCLKCICQPFNECKGTIVCSQDFSYCGPFSMTQAYWSAVGLLPANRSTLDSVEGWHLCAMDYDCSASTVKINMRRGGKDGNGDDVVTCEDYILIHRYGTTGCLDYTVRDGGIKFRQHQACLKAMTFEEEITVQATHDESLGFTLKGTVDYNGIYTCSSPWQNVQYSYVYVPLSSANEVPSQLYFNYSDVPVKGSNISCTIGTERFESIKLILASCQSLTQCDLKFRPYSDLGKIEGETRRKSNRQTVTTRLVFHEGIVGCTGLDNNTSNVFKYVRHFDYFFTGLDSQLYFTSSEFPTSAVLRFDAVRKNSMSSYKYTCRVSTFLVLPVFQFVFHHSDGSVQFLPLNSTLTQGKLETSYGQLSSIRKQAADAERSIELKQSLNVAHISCRVRLVNSNEWINETLGVSPTDTAGNTLLTSEALTITIVSNTVLCAVVVILLLKIKRRVEPLTEDEMQQFLEGDPTIPEVTTAGDDRDNAYELSIDRMRFPQDARISLERYLIDKRQELGSEHFGRCFKGTEWSQY